MNLHRLLPQLAAVLIPSLALFHPATVSDPKLGPVTPPAIASKRPFRMLVLGDSVMWGQGLQDENKFSEQVRSWVCRQRNNGVCSDPSDVEIHVEAHSGAVIKRHNLFERHDEEECLTKIPPLKCKGEIPYPYPTVLDQVDLARRYYQDQNVSLGSIDLILIDGGINDMHAAKILFPFWGGNISRHAEEYCHQLMKELLAKVTSPDFFPESRIIVTGYFPLISSQTPPETLRQAIDILFPEERAGEEKFAKLFHKLFRLDIEELSERSRTWVRESDAALKNAANEVNQNQSSPLRLTPGSAQAPAEASLHVAFVPIDFAGGHGYAATDETWLWQLVANDSNIDVSCFDQDGQIGKNLKDIIVNDEQQKFRPCMCHAAGRLKGPHSVACVRAGTFHPNTKGAIAYADAINSHLQKIWAFAAWPSQN